MIYEGDAEEWALYLSEVFSHVVKMEATLLLPGELLSSGFGLAEFKLLQV